MIVQRTAKTAAPATRCQAHRITDLLPLFGSAVDQYTLHATARRGEPFSEPLADRRRDRRSLRFNLHLLAEDEAKAPIFLLSDGNV